MSNLPKLIDERKVLIGNTKVSSKMDFSEDTIFTSLQRRHLKEKSRVIYNRFLDQVRSDFSELNFSVASRQFENGPASDQSWTGPYIKTNT